MSHPHQQVQHIVHAVLDVVMAAGTDGMRVSDTFVSVSCHFKTIAQFQSLANCLILAGSIGLREDRLYPTEQGMILLASLRVPVQENGGLPG